MKEMAKIVINKMQDLNYINMSPNYDQSIPFKTAAIGISRKRSTKQLYNNYYI